MFYPFGVVKNCYCTAAVVSQEQWPVRRRLRVGILVCMGGLRGGTSGEGTASLRKKRARFWALKKAGAHAPFQLYCMCARPWLYV